MMVRTLLRLAGLLAALPPALGAAHAMAQPAACPAATFAGELPAAATDLRRQLAALDPLAEACDARADFHAWRGALLLQAGLPAPAATALEKALLLNPDLAGARLDYAIALGQTGQPQAARELAAQVAQRPDVPAGLQGWLRGALASGVANPGATSTAPRQLGGQAPGSSAAPGWTWAALLQAGVGHESNLAGNTSTSALTLQLPGGPVDVALADSERPRPGAAIRELAALQAERLSAGGGRLRVGLLAEGRQATSVAGGTQSGRFQAGYSLPLGGVGAVHLGLGATQLRQPNGSRYEDQSYSALFEPGGSEPGTSAWARATPWLGPCTVLGGVAAIRQRYPLSPASNGTYTQGRLELGCAPQRGANDGQASGSTSTPAQTLAVLTAGSDRPDNADRPGGARRRAELLLRHERPSSLKLPGWLTQPQRWVIWARGATSRDALEFSPLLAVGRVETQRLDWGLGHWWRVADGWSAGVEIEAIRQGSTNPLLRVNSQAAYLLLRWEGASR